MDIKRFNFKYGLKQDNMNGKKIFVNKMIWIICDIRGNGTGREGERER